MPDSDSASRAGADQTPSEDRQGLFRYDESRCGPPDFVAETSPRGNSGRDRPINQGALEVSAHLFTKEPLALEERRPGCALAAYVF